MTDTPRAAPGWRPRIVQSSGQPSGTVGVEDPPVAILLSLYNGEAFLNHQLDSFLSQQYQNWTLFWRDDGSSDASRAILLSFQANRGAGRCVEVEDPDGPLGIVASYACLLAAVPADHMVAFADQDDVWLPEKLTRAVTALSDVAGTVPALYCARQILTDRVLHEVGLSPDLPNDCRFPAALAQNIATGCTVLLNARACALLSDVCPPPDMVLHDWWAYLVVTAAGGVVKVDPHPAVLYRQHGGNAVGASASWLRRAQRAAVRGPRVFMTILRSNIAALLSCQDHLDRSSVAALRDIQAALRGGFRDRLRILKTFPNLTRMTLGERVVFRVWFLFG